MRKEKRDREKEGMLQKRGRENEGSEERGEGKGRDEEGRL